MIHTAERTGTGGPASLGRVLVVEDEAIIAMDVALALEDAGYEVVGPFSGTLEARAWLERGSLAAAVLDLREQDGAGLDLARELLRRGTPFVIHSAYASPAVRGIPELSGAVWLDKPSDSRDLLAAVAALARPACACCG